MDLSDKRLELLREIVPGLRKLGILVNVAYPAAAVEMGQVHATARSLGLEMVTLEVRRGPNYLDLFRHTAEYVDEIEAIPTLVTKGSTKLFSRNKNARCARRWADGVR
jgi:putative tryptophan/tyrosine transport system substrate-binding protein